MSSQSISVVDLGRIFSVREILLRVSKTHLEEVVFLRSESSLGMQAEGKQRIVIVLTGALGDIARGVSILSPLKDSHSESHVTWIVEERWRSLVDQHPMVDEVISFDRKKGVAGALELWRKLTPLHFDVCLDLQRHLKSGLFSWFTGAARRIGFHPRNAKEGNWFFQTE